MKFDYLIPRFCLWGSPRIAAGKSAKALSAAEAHAVNRVAAIFKEIAAQGRYPFRQRIGCRAGPAPALKSKVGFDDTPDGTWRPSGYSFNPES